jgi:hypothetical protein
MANSKKGGKPTVKTGAMTLVMLVNLYRSQMVALLLKNGVAVPQGSSNERVAMLMASLLKVSTSFVKDLNNFLANPSVLANLSGSLEQTAQYFRMSGKPYMNFGDDPFDYSVPDSVGYQSEYGLDLSTDSSTTTTSGSGSGDSWWSGIKANLGNYLSDGIKLIGTISTNNTNAEIANAQRDIANAGAGGSGAGAGAGTGAGTGGKLPTDEGMSTTTVVLLSLGGIAVIGLVIYLVTRPKE